MKLHLFILILVLVNAKRIVDPKQVLAELDANHTGKTFLDAIQIGLATGSPIHEI